MLFNNCIDENQNKVDFEEGSWPRGGGGRGVGGQQLKSYNSSGDTMAPEACSTSN